MEMPGIQQEDMDMPRKTYNANTGFAIMVNLYIIRYISYHIKKASDFSNDEESLKSIYEKLHISRQRFGRINKGFAFEMTRDEAEHITNMFGIGKKYFIEEPQEILDIGVTEADWKCFYEARYKVKFKNIDYKKSGKAEKIKKALKELTSDWEKKLAQQDPMYAINYYFRHGRKFDNFSKLQALETILNSITYEVWENLSIESLEKYKKLLEDHCRYVNAFITIRQFINKS